jgi:hypothetical protein
LGKKKESSRFLKKAAQKLSLNRAGGGETSTPKVNQVFLLLFVYQKKRFLLLACPFSMTLGRA